MNSIIIKCLKSDESLVSTVQDNFENVSLIEENSFSGEDFIIILIPLAQLTTQIIDFICTHLAKPNKHKEEKNEIENRVIVSPDGEISLIGYPRNDVIKILKGLGFNL